MARRAQAVSVPRLDDERRRLAGAGDYDAMCAGCHGAPGREPGAVGKGLNPAPPDLAESASHLTDAELFWVTKHGIRMTGMPAWGATHSDHDLVWVVAFIRELPRLEAEQYRDWVERSVGLGHH
jgi:mono/diheme cytochrome c family protein